MSRQKLLQYIRQAHDRGVSIEEIQQELKTVGWGEVEITDALNTFKPKRVTKKALEEITPTVKRPSMPWFHIGMYTFCIACIVTLIWFLVIAERTKDDRVDMQNPTVQAFLHSLSKSQVSFTDAGDIVFPDEEKFLTRKETYIQEQKNFVAADLQKMELTLYEVGVATKTVPILTKGKEGSWWETPTGDYFVLGKSPTAFSSIGHVWMPYSVRFYGNYFIHGWPHYNDGTPVASTYSGGCIRLSNENAETVFNFVELDTPILVLEDENNTAFGSFSMKAENPTVPKVEASSFLISNLVTGERILERKPDVKTNIGSLAALMTATVAHETIYLGRSIYVNDAMRANVGQAFSPEVGDTYVGLDLLYPLLTQSSPDVAWVLARAVNEKTFIKNLNNKAQSLGMRDSYFVDPAGEEPETVATVSDIHKLLTYLYFKRPFIYEITRGKIADSVGFIALGDTIAIETLENTNYLFEEPELIGVKSSFDDAGVGDMTTVWNLGTETKQIPIAITVLDTPDQKKDTEILWKWFKDNYSKNNEEELALEE